VACGVNGDDPSHGDASFLDASVGGDGSQDDGAVGVDAHAPPDASVDADPGFQCPDPDPCDPVDGMGCGETYVCVLGSGGAMCTPSAGETEAGEPCEAYEQCAFGLACFATREGAALCDRLCCDDADCLEWERCGAGEGHDGEQIAYGRCHPAEARCDVLDPIATCEPGEACYIVSLTGGVGCRRKGEAEVDEACTHQNDCAPGLACRGLTSTCKRLCATDDDASCPEGEGTCLRSESLLLPEGVGLCTMADRVAESQ
jgi:hypothetical protein